QAGGEQMARKMVNDAAALARAIAETRGRNADWASEAVRQSVSATAKEAAEQNVVDALAPSSQAVLEYLDERTIDLPQGTMTPNTTGAEVEAIEPTIQERALSLLGHPNVAYALLRLGMLGITIE